MKQKQGRWRMPSPALVVALIALFVALGGTATALKGRNSVKRDDIAPRAVSNPKIAPKAVTAGKIRPNAVRRGHIADRAVGPWKTKQNVTAAVAGESSTTSTVPVDLGGPTATVKVPSGGLVAIQAQATMRATGNNAGRVYLYEPTAVSRPSMLMRTASSSFQTRYSVPGTAGSGADEGVSNKVRSGWIVIAAPAGTRTFQLRYSATGGTAIFKDRRITVSVIR